MILRAYLIRLTNGEQCLAIGQDQHSDEVAIASIECSSSFEVPDEISIDQLVKDIKARLRQCAKAH